MPDRKAHRRTLVTFLLDHSAPMTEIRDTTIAGFNSYLDILKAAGDRIEFTLLLYNSEGLDQLHVGEPIVSVPHLTRKTYAPRGTTPLIDAAHKGITAIEECLRNRKDKPKVVVSIQSGSEDNASTEHTWNELAALVTQQAARGWEFNVLGAGMKVADQGRRMDLDPFRILRYDPSSAAKTKLSFRLAARNIKEFACGEVDNTGYSGWQMCEAQVLFPPVARS